jgi:hypothetical protein
MSVIHPLQLRYSNAYLVVGTRSILVDTGSRGDAPAIVAGCVRVALVDREHRSRDGGLEGLRPRNQGPPPRPARTRST